MKRITLTAIAAGACMMAAAGSAQAAPMFAAPSQANVANGVEAAVQHSRERYYYSNNNYRYANRYQRSYYGEPVSRSTRVWRGRDGRVYCRKRNGTTGLIVGGALGALLGRELDQGYNRSTGTILGAAGGALLGREVAKGGGRCR